MDLIDFSDVILSESDGVFTLKNNNTTLGFVRFNNKGEVEYTISVYKNNNEC